MKMNGTKMSRKIDHMVWMNRNLYMDEENLSLQMTLKSLRMSAQMGELNRTLQMIWPDELQTIVPGLKLPPGLQICMNEQVWLSILSEPDELSAQNGLDAQN
jgi:hypothetical protein